MVNLKYVKRKITKRVMAIISAVSCVGLSIFITIAFLGDTFGTFNVALKGNDVSLALSDKKSFENETSFLRVNNVPALNMYSNARLMKHNELDNEESPYTLGAKYDEDKNINSLYFFKYTFYVKNTSVVSCSYDVNINIIENTKPKNVTYTLDEILRVRLYYGDVDNVEFNYDVYARKSKLPHYDLDDIKEEHPHNKEYVAGDEASATFDGFATPFINNTTIAKKHMSHIKSNEVKRFTIVYWLEGDDPEAQGAAPVDASLKLDVQIEGFIDEA